jgi:hypothetical protein
LARFAGEWGGSGSGWFAALLMAAAATIVRLRVCLHKTSILCRTTQNVVVCTTQNVVVRHKIWSYDTKCGCTTQNVVVRHKMWLYDTKCGRTTQNVVVRHKLKGFSLCSICTHTTKFGCMKQKFVLKTRSSLLQVANAEVVGLAPGHI